MNELSQREKFCEITLDLWNTLSIYELSERWNIPWDDAEELMDFGIGELGYLLFPPK